jgi:hypothetical protein
VDVAQLQRSLEELRREQARVQDAIRTLEQLIGAAKPNRLSPQGRARISEAARKRWEEHRREQAMKAVARAKTGPKSRRAA